MLLVVGYLSAAAILPFFGSKMKDAPLRACNALGMIWQALFISIVLHCLKPILSLEHPTGQETLISGPDVLVGSPAQKRLEALGIAQLLIYGEMKLIIK